MHLLEAFVDLISRSIEVVWVSVEVEFPVTVVSPWRCRPETESDCEVISLSGVTVAARARLHDHENARAKCQAY